MKYKFGSNSPLSGFQRNRALKRTGTLPSPFYKLQDNRFKWGYANTQVIRCKLISSKFWTKFNTHAHTPISSIEKMCWRKVYHTSLASNKSEIGCAVTDLRVEIRIARRIHVYCSGKCWLINVTLTLKSSTDCSHNEPYVSRCIYFM